MNKEGTIYVYRFFTIEYFLEYWRKNILYIIVQQNCGNTCVYDLHDCTSTYDTELNRFDTTCVNVQITYPTSQLVEIVH